MKKKINILVILLSIFIFAFIGCEEKVLNKEPLNTFSENDVWTDIVLIDKFVTSTYQVLNDYSYLSSYKGANVGGGIRFLLSSATSHSFVRFSGTAGTYQCRQGTITPSDMGGGIGKIWPQKYYCIRNCNLFFERIGNIKAANTQEEKKIQSLTGEMKYLRAYSYADLISYFGGVPLITETFELKDDFMLPRNSYAEIVDWIVKELNEAQEMLPGTRSSDEMGRINKGACMALKSRILLYAASKLHDPRTEPSGPLFDYDKSNKWQQAADAAKAVIDLPEYSLVKVETFKDYQQIFLENNSEVIFFKYFSTAYMSIETGLNCMNAPNGFTNGRGGNTPTSNIVDLFEMSNGKMINEPGSGYSAHVDSMYKNRELRFYANILYEGGCEFRGRVVEFYLPGGKDSEDGILPAAATRTGYYMRKFSDETIDYNTEFAPRIWIYERLATFYLNYAEAQYHLGNEEIAREYINLIRNRVHLPDINTSGEELLKDIMHERIIELCFETYSYFFDLRRWMIGEEFENKDSMGLNWRKENEAGKLDPNGKLVYYKVVAQKCNFYPRNYYLPIPLGEIEKCNLLEQNPGYD